MKHIYTENKHTHIPKTKQKNPTQIARKEIRKKRKIPEKKIGIYAKHTISKEENLN